MTEDVSAPRKTKKQRSPSYPSIDLEAALERAGQLYAREGLNYAPIPSILEAWGYASKSSGGLLAVAALKRFGLLEDEGSTAKRQARITELAQAILLDEREDGSERLSRIQEAALNPPIHREIWDKYQGNLPSDSTLKYYLTVDRGFTSGGAREFIAEFRKTLEFSKIGSQDASVLDNEGDTGSTRGSQPLAVQGRATLGSSVTPRGGQTVLAPGGVVMGTAGVTMLEIPVPIGGTFARLSLPASMTESDWARVLAVMAAYKPAIVKDDLDPELNEPTIPGL